MPKKKDPSEILKALCVIQDHDTFASVRDLLADRRCEPDQVCDPAAALEAARTTDLARVLDAGVVACCRLPNATVKLPRKPDGLDTAESRNRLARLALQEETRSIRDELNQQMRLLDQRTDAAAKRFQHSTHKALRAHALATFVRAGGMRAQFDRLWPYALREAIFH